MASENETVADIAREMKSSHEGMIAFEFMSIADRIEAAHRREVAELRECLSEAIYSSCVKCKLYNSRRRQCSFSSGACDDIEKWRKALEGANHDNA